MATTVASSKRKRRTLGDELRFIVYLVSGTAMLMAGVVYVAYQAFALYSHAVAELASSGEMVAADLSAALVDNDSGNADNVLTGLTTTPDSRTATVYRSDGSVFASTTSAQASVPVTTVRDSRFGTRLAGGQLVHTEPLLIGGRVIGALQLRTSLSRYYRDLYRNIIVGAMVIALAFGLAFIVSLRLQRRITRPINALIASAQTIVEEPSSLDAFEGEFVELAELNDVYRNLLTRIEEHTAALDKNTDYYLSVVNNAVDVIAILNPDGSIRFVNNAVKRLLGYEPDELIDRYPTELAEPGDCTPLTDVVLGNRKLAQGEHLVLEVRTHHKDGSLYPFEVTVTNLTEDPLVAGLVLNARDVRLHKQVVEQHRETREFLDAVFENIPHMIFVKEAEQLRFVRFNKAVETILGYPRESFLGKNDFDIFPSEQAKFFTDTDRKVLSGSKVLDIPEEAVVAQDGSVRTLHTKKIPIALGDGQARYLLGISEDITERKVVEQEIRLSEERYRSVMEHAADAFFLHDMTGRFIDVNRQACESLGYTREELLTMTVPDIEMNFNAEDVRTRWRDLKRNIPQTVSGNHRRKDGTTFPVEVRLRLIRFADEQQVIATARDISGFLEVQAELREAKEAAEAANRIKSEFLANMSHEIRTPINAVVGMTDLLLRTPLGPKQQDYIRAVRSSGDLLTTIIDDILDISQLEVGQLALQTGEFFVEDLIEPILDMLGHRAYTKGIELACRYPIGELPMLSGDCNRIRQVLVNLVGNAVKFTDRGWVLIDVGVESESDDDIELKFTVEDTGIGIDAEQKNGLFKPFTQLETAIHRRSGGVGLGLSISKRLVSLMGGQIGVDGSPREGSKFWFTLSLPKISIEVSKDEGAVDKPVRILFVDDNPVIGHATRDCFAAKKLQVDIATSAESAMERLTSVATHAPYTVAIIDAEMPGVDGVSLARRIRGTPSIAATDIILLPSIANPLTPGVASDLDARCVNKPIVPRILLHSVYEEEPTNAASSPTRIEDAGVEQAARPRILVAEDNPVNQAVLSDMLAMLDCPGECVSDGPTALEATEEADYDVVLLDCQMPGLDGIEVAREIRRRTGSAIKPVIIAVTAYAFESDTQRCLEAGMNDVMHKPVRLESLQRVLDRWLARSPGEGEMPAVPEGSLDGEVWRDVRARSANDKTFMTKFVALFNSDTEGRLVNLAGHLHARRYHEAARAAHAVRAGCLQVGARRLADLCSDLEESAKQRDGGRSDALFPRIMDEFARVRELLDREMGTP
ncbi:MAG: PAS domain S-box protein [Gammaproteobacteria bacterium]|nr:PAS domain S-box protein [Gammaproteobacteria bacterium]